MLVTKNAAELCVLLIHELYGQLPSRIFELLLSKGRTTTQRLGNSMSLNQRNLRRGLAVLIQQNLIFHHTDPDTSITHYEANPEVAYNLVRTGKILDTIHRNYGEAAKEMVYNILLNGHMKVSEVMQLKSRGLMNGSAHPNGANGHANGASSETSATAEDDKDQTQETFDLIAYLIATGILEPLNMRMLQCPQDVRTEIDQELMKEYPSGLRGSKQKTEFNQKAREAWRDIQDESKDLKRKLEPDYIYGSGAKRRKLANGGRTNGFSAADRDDILDPNTIVRVNYAKCLVELRNRKLVQYAEDLIGSVTAQVYGAMLAALGKKLAHCQVDVDDEADDMFDRPSVTTMEIYEHLKPSFDIFAGIGKCDPEEINAQSAEKIQRNAPGSSPDDDEYGNVSDEDEGMIGGVRMGNGAPMNRLHGADTKIVPSQNGSRETKVKFADRVPNKAERIQQMRQHLLILAESNQQFLRHSGTRDQGEWTVDFELLIQKLKLMEMDTLVEESFGRQGLRLVKILRDKGKIDDRALPGLALMKKADVLVKMAEMELAGYLDVQEVPRDNNRTANRTLFLWFFDQERSLTRMLDNAYKAMVRHFQRLEVERVKKKNILSVVERKDVQGMEEEKLNGDAYNEFLGFLEIEGKLLGQVSRLDDLVAVFRDY